MIVFAIRFKESLIVLPSSSYAIPFSITRYANILFDAFSFVSILISSKFSFSKPLAPEAKKLPLEFVEEFVGL